MIISLPMLFGTYIFLSIVNYHPCALLGRSPFGALAANKNQIIISQLVYVFIRRNIGTPEGRVALTPRTTAGIPGASAPAATRTRRLQSRDHLRPSPAEYSSCTGWTACPSTATGCSTCSACTGTWRRWRSWGTTRCSSSWKTRKPPDGACPTCTCSSWTTRSTWKSSESTRQCPANNLHDRWGRGCSGVPSNFNFAPPVRQHQQFKSWKTSCVYFMQGFFFIWRF